MKSKNFNNYFKKQALKKDKENPVFMEARETFPLKEIFDILDKLQLEPQIMDDLKADRYGNDRLRRDPFGKVLLDEHGSPLRCRIITSKAPGKLGYNENRRRLYYYEYDGLFYYHSGEEGEGDTFDAIHLISKLKGKDPFLLAKSRLKHFDRIATMEDESDLIGTFNPIRPRELPTIEYLPGIKDCYLKQEWIDDGIPEYILQEFGIQYELRHKKYGRTIVIPYYSASGRLVGYNRRLLDAKIEKKEQKYSTMWGFQKGEYLFGLDKAIFGDTLIVFEGAKAVMKCHRMGMKNCVSTGGAKITRQQLFMLINLGVKTIVLAYDKDKQKSNKRTIHNLRPYFKVIETNYERCGEKENITDGSMEDFKFGIKYGTSYSKQPERQMKKKSTVNTLFPGM